jgi:VCBS repeat-containing protein
MAILSTEVGNEVFLQGAYLSVGINKDGTLGTTGAAPAAGYATNIAQGYLRVGLFADFDGFGAGKASTLNDAVLGGVAVEGFNIGYKVGGKTFVQSNQMLDGLSEIAGSGDASKSGAKAQASWHGETTEKLDVAQMITLSNDAKYLRFDVVLTNESGSDMADLRYMRTLDPDHGSTFVTNNTIVKQGAGEALVAAYASGTTNPAFFYANDKRAVASTYGWINEDPYAAAAYGAPQAAGYTLKGDSAINLTFSVGTLKAGQSTTLTFYMGLTNDLTGTVAAINAEAGGTPTVPTTPPVENTAPVAVADKLAVIGTATGKGNVLSNDSDKDGDALTAALKSGPAHGTLTLSATGAYTYVADAGYVGQDTFTYTASDGKASSSATVTISVAALPNVAPIAINDALTVVGTAVGTGNVLANDSDADGGNLTAALANGAANGKVTLAADGSFSYVANAGYTGTDSFTYSASDGKASSTATVSITVAAPEVPTDPSLPDSRLLKRAGTLDGSASTDDILTGATFANTFYFDRDAQSGNDRIVNFGKNDVLVTKGALYDSNGDGIINYQRSKLVVDTPQGDKDTITTPGVGSLRYMGTDEAGLSVYASAVVRPKSTVESRLGDDVMKGDTIDKGKNVFFFDTALGMDLGSDTIINFGAKDLLVTTTALNDGNGDGHIALGAGGRLDMAEGGTVAMSGLRGSEIGTLEFDGTMLRDGVTYYVYSLDGSAAGTPQLIF